MGGGGVTSKCGSKNRTGCLEESFKAENRVCEGCPHKLFIHLIYYFFCIYFLCERCTKFLSAVPHPPKKSHACVLECAAYSRAKERSGGSTRRKRRRRLSVFQRGPVHCSCVLCQNCLFRCYMTNLALTTSTAETDTFPSELFISIEYRDSWILRQFFFF